jgi:hypothetical protein
MRLHFYLHIYMYIYISILSHRLVPYGRVCLLLLGDARWNCVNIYMYCACAQHAPLSPLPSLGLPRPSLPQGSEFADGPSLTVPAQVKRLIDEAQDPHRLAVLFPGWQPWV